MSPEIKYLKIGEWKCLSSIKGFLRSGHSGFFSIVDARKVISLEQIKISYARALRMVQNSERIKRAESAFLMLLSGQAQISRAQEEVGISSSTDSVLIVYDNDSDIVSCFTACGGSLIPVKEIPIPDRAPDMDGTVFSRMALVELSL